MSDLPTDPRNPADYNGIRHRLYARAMDELYWPRPAKTFVPLAAKEGLYDVARQAIGDCPMTYLEFGVHAGWSFTKIAERFGNPGVRMYGFDSFEGLPERWSAEMNRGHFSRDGQLPDFHDDRAQFVKGWFQNTLPEFLRQTSIAGPVLIHYDADLYSSTLFLLSAIWQHIPEYYFIFDEFQPDEIIAMNDFTKAYPVEFEFLACTRDEHGRPQQILGKMRNIPLAP
jgi:hypothetical protein